MESASSKLPERSLLGFFTHPGTLEEYLNLDRARRWDARSLAV